jgi:hypothetical protein
MIVEYASWNVHVSDYDTQNSTTNGERVLYLKSLFHFSLQL